MVSDLHSWEGEALPKAPIFISPRRRLSLRMLSRSPQLLALTGACLGIAALVCLAVGYTSKSRLVSEEDTALARAESANAALQDELAKLEDALDATNRSLAEAQGRIGALTEEAQTQLRQQRTDLQQQLAASKAAASSMTGRIADLQRELRETRAQRAPLSAELGKAEADLRTELQRQAELQTRLANTEKRLQQMSRDRIASTSERPAPADKKPSAAEPSPAPGGKTAQDSAVPASRSAGFEGGKLAELERALAAAGVDVRRVFAQFATTRGEGGPFIPAPNGQLPTSGLSAEQLAVLRRVVTSLPLTAPLSEYELESPFGLRRDPFNGRTAFHTGVDLVAPYMSPVYATAAGTVAFAGYRGDYGKMVEIDHGNGISTRYGHLHRYTVAEGEKVQAHALVGLLGSTGRATGPHVHYEVLINGEPQNPQKFIGLSRLVPASQ